MALNRILNKYYIYKDTKLKKRKKEVIKADVNKNIG